MSTFMRQLRALAETYFITILVSCQLLIVFHRAHGLQAINTSTIATPQNRDLKFSWTDRKPALGPSFTFLTDTTIWLSKYNKEDQDQDASLHIAEVLRSRSVVCSILLIWIYMI